MQKTNSSSMTDYFSSLSSKKTSNSSSSDLVTRSVLSGLSGGGYGSSTAAISKLLSEKIATQKKDIASLEEYSKNSTAFYKDFNALTSELKNSSLALKNTDFTLSTPTASTGTTTGTTTTTTGTTTADKDKQIAAIVANVKDFASDYNKLGAFFQDNAKLSSTTSNFATSFKAAKYNERAYESIGINVDSSGKLSVDEKKLTAALNSDSKSVGQLIGGSGLAGTAYNKTNAAVNVSDNLYPALKLSGSASNLNSMGALLGLTLDFYA
ncbi:MAG: flagellar filament capping protein FliD [Selenomonadaceae bacterium]